VSPNSGWLHPRIGIMLPLGFASGLPLALSGATLQAWLADSDVDIRTIGLLNLAGLPYTFKFLWAGFLDRLRPLPLDRRRGWMVLTQLALALAVLLLAQLDPRSAPLAIGLLAATIAFLSATQDVAFDAYRAEVLSPVQRGPGTAVSVLGYRLGMLTSGGLTLVLAAYAGWQAALSVSALLLAGLSLVSLLAPRPPAGAEEGGIVRPDWLRDIFLALRPLLGSREAVALVLLVLFYKLGDAWVASLSSAFLLRGAGFALETVGYYNKTLAIVATLVGAFLGAEMLRRLGLARGLLLAAWLQAVSNLGFLWLAWVPQPEVWRLCVVVVTENLAGGIGTVPLLALMMALTDARHTAVQFALLSAVTALARVLLGPVVGEVVAATGWVTFFQLGLLAAVPGLVLAHRLMAAVSARERSAGAVRA
jgi:MFS transporter, PAT family, beta-lactamase induction signal transducer AmpG